MIPGLNPGLIAGGVRRLTTTSVVATAFRNYAAHPNNITIPTVQDGDFLFYLSNGESSLNPTFSVPTGWDQIVTWRPPGASYLIRAHTMCRIATSALSGTTINTGNNVDFLSRLLVVVRGDIPITGFTVHSVNSDYDLTDDLLPQAITSVNAVPPAMAFATYQSTGVISPRTFTIGGVGAKDGEMTPSPGFTEDKQWIAWKSFDIGGVNPASVLVDMQDEGSDNFMSSCYIDFT